MVLPASVHATLWLRKLYEVIDYTTLGVDPKLVHYDSGSVALANQFILPAYNKDVLPPQDVPRRWEDFLDPKWRGGKLAVPIGTSYFAFLAIGPWGEQKTTEYVKALAQQQLNIGPPGAVYSRLLLGEGQARLLRLGSFVPRWVPNLEAGGRRGPLILSTRKKMTGEVRLQLPGALVVRRAPPPFERSSKWLE